jgi:hypothetical protein
VQPAKNSIAQMDIAGINGAAFELLIAPGQCEKFPGILFKSKLRIFLIYLLRRSPHHSASSLD